jgi:hypothetical protein
MAKSAFGSGVLAAAFVLAVSGSAFAQVPGALFTTVMDGTRVNANLYPTKCGPTGVWLDGGPGPNAPQGAAGLPDGDYYFQVTDPSGKTLLSTDPVQRRQFNVTAGIISGLSGLGNHNTGLDTDHGATTVELCPYNDTPNPGGVYKAWITPVGQFVGDPTAVDNPCGHGCFHGFVPAFSKTDNFKVNNGATGGACLEVLKVLDVDGNHKINEPPDQLVAWPVTITDPIGSTNTFFTGTVKECTFAQLVPGSYLLTEGATNGTGTFAVSFNWIDGSYIKNPDDTVLVRMRDTDREVIFGNVRIQ